jgi:hypothetical protein
VNSKTLIRTEDANEMISEIIKKGNPAMVARFGSNEALCTAEGIGIFLGMRKHFSKKTMMFMHNNAGLFPDSEETAIRFCELSCEAAGKIDLLGYWGTFMQDYLAMTICSPNAKLTALSSLEPYYSTKPWTAALQGKKVLVIHPFKKTIESQYKKRTVLFDDPNILPQFELTVIQAVQTIAGENSGLFAKWEDALNYMYAEAMKCDFDIAIIGCGAYGMPLAAKIKDSGKIAIHLGGATQLLFGIKGARWDNHPLSRLYNENWVRPLQEETPQFANRVEGACYW